MNKAGWTRLAAIGIKGCTCLLMLTSARNAGADCGRWIENESRYKEVSKLLYDSRPNWRDEHEVDRLIQKISAHMPVEKQAYGLPEGRAFGLKILPGSETALNRVARLLGDTRGIKLIYASEDLPWQTGMAFFGSMKPNGSPYYRLFEEVPHHIGMRDEVMRRILKNGVSTDLALRHEMVHLKVVHRMRLRKLSAFQGLIEGSRVRDYPDFALHELPAFLEVLGEKTDLWQNLHYFTDLVRAMRPLHEEMAAATPKRFQIDGGASGHAATFRSFDTDEKVSFVLDFTPRDTAGHVPEDAISGLISTRLKMYQALTERLRALGIPEVTRVLDLPRGVSRPFTPAAPTGESLAAIEAKVQGALRDLRKIVTPHL